MNDRSSERANEINVINVIKIRRMFSMYERANEMNVINVIKIRRMFSMYYLKEIVKEFISKSATERTNN